MESFLVTNYISTHPKMELPGVRFSIILNNPAISHLAPQSALARLLPAAIKATFPSAVIRKSRRGSFIVGIALNSAPVKVATGTTRYMHSKCSCQGTLHPGSAPRRCSAMGDGGARPLLHPRSRTWRLPAESRHSKLASDDKFLAVALSEARKGLAEGGIPIGAALVIDGKVYGRGHNQRVQKGSAILHGETDALENAGRLPATLYARATMYTSLSPCAMCSGTILLYKIPRVVIGENTTFIGEEALLLSRGVEVICKNAPEFIELMQTFISKNPQLWNEDIGEEDH